MTWRCEKCKAIVADTADFCPLCDSGSGTVPETKKRQPIPRVTDEELEQLQTEVDAEGYTMEERMRVRPTREVANSHLLLMQKLRQMQNRRRNKKKSTVFEGAVDRGSIRTSRPIFFRPIRGI